MQRSHVVYKVGLPDQLRSAAAILYDDAFEKKFSVAIRSKEARLSLLSNSFMSEYAIVALSDDSLIGIAGFHTPSGSLTGGITYRRLLTQLGFIRGNWAALIFNLYERSPKPKELVMDGIAVQSSARGKGIGGQLLEEIVKYAKECQFNRVRLDVIDINEKAKQLYERKSFKAVGTQRFPYLRWLLGFSASTTMEIEIEENAP